MIGASKTCTSGACCSKDGYYKAAGTVCSVSSNPCADNAVCDGKSEICPEKPKKSDGAVCMSNGQCSGGYCVQHECTGLCCVAGLTAPDGTPCGTIGGQCIAGTCTLKTNYPGKAPKDKHDLQVDEKGQQIIKDEIESLLRSHARYIRQVEESADIANGKVVRPTKDKSSSKSESSTTKKTSSTTSSTTSTSDLSAASSSSSSYSFFSWSTLVIAAAFIVIIAVIVVAVKKFKGKQADPYPDTDDEQEEEEEPLKKASDTDTPGYEPPTF